MHATTNWLILVNLVVEKSVLSDQEISCAEEIKVIVEKKKKQLLTKGVKYNPHLILNLHMPFILITKAQNVVHLVDQTRNCRRILGPQQVML